MLLFKTQTEKNLQNNFTRKKNCISNPFRYLLFHSNNSSLLELNNRLKTASLLFNSSGLSRNTMASLAFVDAAVQAYYHMNI